MKERQILFNGAMVRAILEGRKTQTRRVIKPQPPQNGVKILGNGGDVWTFIGRHPHYQSNTKGEFAEPVKCPYEIGMHLWVRERTQIYGRWQENGISPTGRQKWKFIQNRFRAVFYEGGFITSPKNRRKIGFYTRPSIFMPRWASRITLEVTGVRVERVQDITEADAEAEGMDVFGDGAGFTVPLPNGKLGSWTRHPESAFWTLWDQVNAKRSFGWAANPWVWVVEFRRVKG